MASTREDFHIMGSIELSKFLLVVGVVAEAPSVGPGLPSGDFFRIALCRNSHFEILDKSNLSKMATDT